MTYLGDIIAGDVLDFKFTSRSPTTFTPTSLEGASLVVYKDNDAVQAVDGVTLTTNFDSVVGSNHVRIDTNAEATFYSAGSNFQVQLAAGTVDSISVIGEVVGHFSIEHRSTSVLATQASVDDLPNNYEFNIAIQSILDAAALLATQASVDDLPNNYEFNVEIQRLLDAIALVATQASVDDLPNNYEFNVAIESVLNSVATRASQVSLDAASASILADIAALNDLSSADVQAAVAAALAVTRAEPGQGTPGATISPLLKLDYLYQWARNRKTATSSQISHYADDGVTVAQKATHSDDGTTYDRGEMATGP